MPRRLIDISACAALLLVGASAEAAPGGLASFHAGIHATLRGHARSISTELHERLSLDQRPASYTAHETGTRLQSEARFSVGTRPGTQTVRWDTASARGSLVDRRGRDYFALRITPASTLKVGQTLLMNDTIAVTSIKRVGSRDFELRGPTAQVPARLQGVLAGQRRYMLGIEQHRVVERGPKSGRLMRVPVKHSLWVRGVGTLPISRDEARALEAASTPVVQDRL